MPLKDRDRTRPRRLVRLGIIRLGYKETKEKKRRDGSTYTVEYPVQADHFVLTDAPEVAGVYGEQPRELDVILPFPDIERNFDAAYTVWAGGVLLCRGDGDYVDYATPHRAEEKRGRTSVYNVAGDTLVSNGVAQINFEWNGELFRAGDHVPCPGAKADAYPHCCACRVSAVLKVMMARPDLFRLGYYQIATGSGRNYDTILGTLELIHGQTGRVNGIPFKLRLVKESTVYRDNGKRKTTEKWFLQLEPDPAFTRQLYRQQAAALLGPGDDPPRQREDDAWEVDFDEVDDPAPPPFAEEEGPVNVDVGTGEITVGEDPGDDGATEAVEKKSWPAKTIKSVMDLGYAKHAKHAVAALNLSDVISPDDAVDVVLVWVNAYAEQRKAEVESEGAAKHADDLVKARLFAQEKRLEVDNDPDADEDAPALTEAEKAFEERIAE